MKALIRLRRRRNFVSARQCLWMLAAAGILFVSFQTAWAKKAKVAPAESTGPIRVAVLPFAVPENDKDLQWTAMAATALVVKAGRNLPDMEVVPFWDVMPSAISEAGAVRSFSDESASALANWVGAKWTIMGEIRRTKSKSSYTIIIDFIPAKSTEVPFRYIRTRRMENFGIAVQLGLRQWLCYITAKHIPLPKVKESGLLKMQTFGEALDKEYGWFTDADPGGSREFIKDLSPADKAWAARLFNPTMYPALADLKLNDDEDE